MAGAEVDRLRLECKRCRILSVSIVNIRAGTGLVASLPQRSICLVLFKFKTLTENTSNSFLHIRYSEPTMYKTTNRRGLMNKVKEYRQARGLTLEMLAKSCKTSKGHLSDLENGNIKKTSVYLAIRLSRSLHTSVQKLFPLD